MKVIEMILFMAIVNGSPAKPEPIQTDSAIVAMEDVKKNLYLEVENEQARYIECWISLKKSGYKVKELDELKVIRKNLIEYCKRDTYAMVKVLDVLRSV